jgi:hypothetical protein
MARNHVFLHPTALIAKNQKVFTGSNSFQCFFVQFEEQAICVKGLAAETFADSNIFTTKDSLHTDRTQRHGSKIRSKHQPRSIRCFFDVFGDV